MTRPSRSDLLPNSYLGAALGRNENRIAATITTAITIVVLLWTFVPMQHGVTVDFRTLGLGSDYHVAFEGFVLTPKKGWRFIGDTGDVIFYRPLPASIEVEVEVWRTNENARPVSLSIGYAGVEREITFDGTENEAENRHEKVTSARVTFEAPRASRRLSFDLPPNAGLHLSSLRISPTGLPR